jgi:hypothetical protein
MPARNRKSAKRRGAAAKRPMSSRDKVRAYRTRMRKRGYRLVQMWLPDTRTKEFAERAHRASLAIARSAHEAEDQAWVDTMSWWNSPEAIALEARERPTPWWRTDGHSD